MIIELKLMLRKIIRVKDKMATAVNSVYSSVVLQENLLHQNRNQSNHLVLSEIY